MKGDKKHSKNRSKICLVITSRASYARIKSVMREIQKTENLELNIITGASLLLERFGKAIDIIEHDGFASSANIYMVLEGENPITMAKSVGVGLLEIPTALMNLNPDLVITVADRFETIATAISASYMNIPLAHVQGGEVSGSIDEKVRHAVTKLSDIHFVSNENSARRVIQMGENPDTVFITGCPSIDLAKEIMQDPKLPPDFFEKYKGVGKPIDLSNGYIIVSQHPVTTEYENSLFQINQTIMAIYELKIPTIWFWPNVDAGSDKISKGIRMFRETYKADFVYFIKNIPPEDFLKLAYNSLCIVGNSSVGIRECSFMGVPCVNIGTRQKGRDRGRNVIDVGYDKDEIKKAIRKQIDIGRYPSDHIYGDGKAGERIAKILSNLDYKNIYKKDFYDIKDIGKLNIKDIFI